ncbi:MAG: type II toxin-antitoxin system VapC family toxin [Marinilabiliaceae bacterium]|nr:type II toxin-antitoxin system VapC family toxin [Marinilabiliaceae bacterium]
MENRIICLDTSVLIDFYRKKEKSKSLFFKLTKKYMFFAVSAVTEYEFHIGNSQEQNMFWDDFFSRVVVLSFDTKVVKHAVRIYKQLKQLNKLIDIPDIMIAGTALQNNMPLATLNRKHFERIDGLTIITE